MFFLACTMINPRYSPKWRLPKISYKIRVPQIIQVIRLDHWNVLNPLVFWDSTLYEIPKLNIIINHHQLYPQIFGCSTWLNPMGWWWNFPPPVRHQELQQLQQSPPPGALKVHRGGLEVQGVEQGEVHFTGGLGMGRPWEVFEVENPWVSVVSQNLGAAKLWMDVLDGFCWMDFGWNRIDQQKTWDFSMIWGGNHGVTR